MAVTALGTMALVMGAMGQACGQSADAGGGHATAESKAAAKKKKQDPIEAQRAIDAALKLVEAGKSEPAVQAFTATLAGGNLPAGIMAKALLYRGIAYRQQQKPAQAIADLTSALWLKGGLSETDRADALRQRASAYQEAGLSESGQATVAAVPGAARPKPQTASSVFSWGAADTTPTPAPAQAASLVSQPSSAPAQPSANGWNLFGNLFGGGATTPVSAPPAKTAPLQSAGSVPEQAATPAMKGWSSNTHVHGASSPIETSAIAAKPEGRFRVQLAIVRSQEEAQAVAAKVKREHAGVLAALEPQIDQAVIGNMGSFYRVRVGPFATQNEGQAVCAKLKGSGLDCLLVTQ
jgi:hypothetical protein